MGATELTLHKKGVIIQKHRSEACGVETHGLWIIEDTEPTVPQKSGIGVTLCAGASERCVAKTPWL